MSRYKGPCEKQGCEKPGRTRKLCFAHWHEWKALNPNVPVNEAPEVRLWAKVNKTASCWNWTGAHMKTGHGNFKVNGKVTLVYRYSYELANGPIADGLVIDHICGNPPCVRPSHLRAVTQKQNMENRAGAHRNSATGVRGVRMTSSGKYRAEVKHLGVNYPAGLYDSLEDAELAAIAKRSELFTCNEVDRLQLAKT